jgi:hypothetical protein
MLYAICYVSSEVNNLSEDDVHKILKQAKINNTINNITGILLYSEGNFFQVIEGDKLAITNLFEEIVNDNRHQNIIKIFEREVYQEPFNGYESRFIAANTSISNRNVDYFIKHIQFLDNNTRRVVIDMMQSFFKDLV